MFLRPDCAISMPCTVARPRNHAWYRPRDTQWRENAALTVMGELYTWHPSDNTPRLIGVALSRLNRWHLTVLIRDEGNLMSLHRSAEGLPSLEGGLFGNECAKASLKETSRNCAFKTHREDHISRARKRYCSKSRETGALFLVGLIAKVISYGASQPSCLQAAVSSCKLSPGQRRTFNSTTFLRRWKLPNFSPYFTKGLSEGSKVLCLLRMLQSLKVHPWHFQKFWISFELQSLDKVYC